VPYARIRRAAGEERPEQIFLAGGEAAKAGEINDVLEQPLVRIRIHVPADTSPKRLTVAVGEMLWVWRVDCQGCAPAAAILLVLSLVQARWRLKLGEDGVEVFGRHLDAPSEALRAAVESTEWILARKRVDFREVIRELGPAVVRATGGGNEASCHDRPKMSAACANE
jgi:hypothetical protein